MNVQTEMQMALCAKCMWKKIIESSSLEQAMHVPLPTLFLNVDIQKSCETEHRSKPLMTFKEEGGQISISKAYNNMPTLSHSLSPGYNNM